ncbi:MAG: NADH-quinone oxidoreductase subunit NuoE [Desulfobacteraceae bacterium]|nr:NADH-quinone oxidoreductase subunit NuoE [Desulfobacteraceae bacterium]
MLPETYINEVEKRLRRAVHPREIIIDVMLEVQQFYGWFSDEALEQTARLLNMSPLEIEELATFYNYIYRQPVGKYVIHVCDSVICWMIGGYESFVEHIQEKLGIRMGQTTDDGMFTLLPVCCLGYCDLAPALMINRTIYGRLTAEKFDQIIEDLRREK